MSEWADWITAGATGATAVLAGVIYWWGPRPRPPAIDAHATGGPGNLISVRIEVHNRGPYALWFREVRAKTKRVYLAMDTDNVRETTAGVVLKSRSVTANHEIAAQAKGRCVFHLRSERHLKTVDLEVLTSRLTNSTRIKKQRVRVVLPKAGGSSS